MTESGHPIAHRRRSAAVFGLFTALALLMTYPLVLHLDRGVRDPGDPLLNSWILAWNDHKIASLDWKGLFDANIFYPNKRTLAYSEFLFTQSLAALPVNLISGNPILAHNLILLLAFITSGFGMYLLASDLTRSRSAGVIAGVIYAFCPFMFAHLSHIQVLSAGGLPLTFLFLHRFFANGSRGDLWLLTLFFILQVLANSYYALYLTLFAGLFILYHMSRRRRWTDSRLWLRLGVFVLVVAAVAGPFFYQYARLQQEMGFSREVGYAARPINYLATSPINRVYGKITAFARSPEGELYPGGIAVVLMLTAFLTGVRPAVERAKFPSRRTVNRRVWAARFLLDGLMAVWLAIVLSIIYGRGFDLTLPGVLKIHAHSLLNPLLTLAALVIGRAAVAVLFKEKADRIVLRGEPPLLIYGAILVLAVLFSMGPKGPYYLLYRFVPGFAGLRVASRFQVFVVFSVAVLAAFGWRALSRKSGGLGRPVCAAVVTALLLVEYFSAPIPMKMMPLKRAFPRVYHWLSSSDADPGPILELPLPMSIETVCSFECQRVYFSTCHWRNMVNGFSGYFAPLYTELMKRWQLDAPEDIVQDLKALRLKYLLVHAAEYSEANLQNTMQELNSPQKGLRLAGQFDDVYVVELSPATNVPPEAPRRPPPSPLKNVAVRANVRGEAARLAVDGSMETRWESGPQKSGYSFEVDLGSVEVINGIALQLGRFSDDYPRGYLAEVSTDGVAWREVARQDKVRLSILAYLQPRSLSLDIMFPDAPARYIKITDTAEDPFLSWSICEIGLFK